MGIEFEISFQPCLQALNIDFYYFFGGAYFQTKNCLFVFFLNEVLHLPVHSVMETVQHNRNGMRI